VPKQHTSEEWTLGAAGEPLRLTPPAASPKTGPTDIVRGTSTREIVASVELAVADGMLRPGAPLPSVRRLAADLGVSPTTAAAAFAELKRRGLVTSKPRSGMSVAARPPLSGPRRALPMPEGTRDLAGGNPDPAFLPDAHRALAALDGLPRLYGEAAVVDELATVARRALEKDGIDATRLCVVSGALDGIERVLGAHLRPGDVVAVEDPGFAGVLDLVRALGLVAVGVPVDDDGPRPVGLENAIGAGARAFILTPRGQNPLGATLSADRAKALVAVLARHPDVVVIEDDHLGPVAGAPARTLAGGRGAWASVRSVSKWLGPDLRLAVLVGDPRTIARVEGRQSVGPGWVSSLLQRAVAALWSDPETTGLAHQAATVYGGRRRALIEALAGHGIRAHGASGLNVYVPVPDEAVAAATLLARGWAVGAGSRHRIESAPALRVTVSTLRPEESRRLASDLADALAPPSRTRAA